MLKLVWSPTFCPSWRPMFLDPPWLLKSGALSSKRPILLTENFPALVDDPMLISDFPFLLSMAICPTLKVVWSPTFYIYLRPMFLDPPWLLKAGAASSMSPTADFPKWLVSVAYPTLMLDYPPWLFIPNYPTSIYECSPALAILPTERFLCPFLLSNVSSIRPIADLPNLLVSEASPTLMLDCPFWLFMAS